MDKELKEAAERYRIISSPDGTAEASYGETGQPASRRVAIDVVSLANAYLAEHPADDGEPVTEEWLESSGFAHDHPRMVLDLGFLCVWQHTYGWYFSVGMGNPKHRDTFTRGHVRRLCQALGIPLTGDTRGNPDSTPAKCLK